MRLHSKIYLGALSCAAFVVPAQAKDMDAMRGHEVLRDFAKCSVKYEHDLAKQVALGRGPANMSEEEVQRAFDPLCLGLWGVRLTGTSLAMRGALAEELVKHDFGQWPQLASSHPDQPIWAIPTLRKTTPGPGKPPAAMQEAFEKLVRDAGVGQLGQCVVRSSPAGAVAVLNTKMDSAAEQSALKAMAPNIAACVKAGETSDFNGDNLRYALAASYYYLANVPLATAVADVRPAPKMPSDALSVQALQNFGTCVVERAPRGARQVLDLDYRSNEYDQQMLAVLKGTDYCLPPGGQMRASPVLYAGAMAEALLKSEVKTDELPQRLAFDPMRPVIKARSPVETMALCAALQAPQATAQLLESEPASSAETEAVSAISPALTECLTKDMKLELNKPALRAVLALAAWRIAETPKVAAQ